MFWSILHRMILWELAKVFTLCLVTITGLLLMAGIVAEASQQGLGPAQILAIIPFLIPSTLPYTIPATTLFATCVVYGRLAHDNEVLAVRAAGVNILRVVWPAVFLGLLMSVATMALYYRTIPYTHRLMRSLFVKDVEEVLYTMLRRDSQINHPKLSCAVFVRQVQGRKLYDAIFKTRDAKGNYVAVAWAREAELHVDMEQRVVQVHMRYGEGGGGGKDDSDVSGVFEDRDFEAPLPSSFVLDHQPRPRDMTWQEMLQRRGKLSLQDEDLAREIEGATARLAEEPGPGELRRHLENLCYLRQAAKQERQAIGAELQMRPALAFGCLFFVLVGCPVGIWLSKSDYLSAFITCFLPIVFVYYPLMLCGTNFAKGGKLDPALAVWSANGLMALIAATLYWRLLKH